MGIGGISANFDKLIFISLSLYLSYPQISFLTLKIFFLPWRPGVIPLEEAL